MLRTEIVYSQNIMKNPGVFGKTSEEMGADKYETYVYHKPEAEKVTGQEAMNHLNRVMVVSKDFKKVEAPPRSVSVTPHNVPGLGGVLFNGSFGGTFKPRNTSTAIGFFASR